MLAVIENESSPKVGFVPSIRALLKKSVIRPCGLYVSLNAVAHFAFIIGGRNTFVVMLTPSSLKRAPASLNTSSGSCSDAPSPKSLPASPKAYTPTSAPVLETVESVASR